MTKTLDLAFGFLYVPNWFLIAGIVTYIATWQYTAQAVATFLGGLLNGVLN